MAGKFELYKDVQSKFRFRLKAGNGEIIAVGEAYESRAGATNGIESIKRNAPEAPIVDLTEESRPNPKPSAAPSTAQSAPAATGSVPGR